VAFDLGETDENYVYTAAHLNSTPPVSLFLFNILLIEQGPDPMIFGLFQILSLVLSFISAVFLILGIQTLGTEVWYRMQQYQQPVVEYSGE